MSLREKIKKAPDAPGVYLMKDEKGVVIYIGKAKSLRKRLQAYLSPEKDQRAKVATMISQVADVEFIETENEVDALLMEARLIRDTQPKFNEELKDSKTFPYLEIRWRDDFPGVYFTRYCDRKTSRYFGPFASAKELRAAVQLMQKVFRYRTCELDIRADDEKRKYNRPCLLYYIDSCSAPCADLISKEEYRQNLRLFCRFLEGKRKRILSSLRKQMKEAADALEFERAARLRDQIKALEALSKRGEFGTFPEVSVGPIINPKDGLVELQKMLELPTMPRTIEGVDIASISGREAVGSVVTFIDGIPFKAGYRRFKIKTVKAVNDYAMMREVVRRRYTRLVREDEVLPDIILIDGGAGHLNAVVAELKSLNIEIPVVMSLAKREEILRVHGREQPLRLPRNSAMLRLFQHVRDEAHRFAQHYHHILRKKRTLEPE